METFARQVLIIALFSALSTVVASDALAASSWVERSTAPGVVYATRFDTPDDVVDWVLPDGTYDNAADNITWEPNLKRSGSGAMRFAMLKEDSTQHGNWHHYLKPDQSTFGAGDEFYIQFTQYFPAYMIEHLWEGSQSGGVSDGFKQMITSSFASSNTPYEVVITNTRQYGYPQVYHQDGVNTAVGLDEFAATACSGTDFVHQPEVDNGPSPLTGNNPDTQAPWTACEQDRARYGGLYSYRQAGGSERPDPLTGAQVYPKDGWMTFLQRVKISASGMTASDNVIELWVAKDGEDYTKIISNSNVRFGGGGEFEAFWLLPYRSNGTANSSRDDTFTVYDEVIVSTDFIPAPAVSGTSGTLPTVNLSVSATSVLAGGSVVLNWTATDADVCFAAGDWSGNVALSGSTSVGPILEQSDYVLTCSNENGSSSDAVAVTIDSVLQDYSIAYSTDTGHSDQFDLNGATVDGQLVAFIDPDNGIDQVRFYVDDLLGLGAPVNTENVAPYDFGSASGFDTNTLSDGLHTLTAQLDLSSGLSDVVTVTFNVANDTTGPQPIIDFRASASSVEFDGFATLLWRVSNATSCTASGAWSGSLLPTGSTAVGPLTADSTFILSCSGLGGTSSVSVTVLVDAPPLPTLTLSASATDVAFGGSADLTWSASNASSCEASGGWSGSRQTDGVETIGPLTTTATYSLTCTGAGGAVTQAVNIDVEIPAAPVISLVATPSQVAFNGAVTLEWAVVGATVCTATGDWSGTQALSGSLTFGPLTSDQNYGLSCTGPGGTTTRSVDVTVGVAASPTLTIAVSPTSIDYADAATLTWSSSNASSCTASGGWSGTQATSGSVSTGPLTGNTTFTLMCSGAGGNVTQSASVTVGAAPLPTISISSSATTVDYNGGATLTWSTQDAQSCTGSGGWSGSLGVSGSRTVGPLQTNTDFVLTCTGAGGSSSESVTINVNDPVPVVSFTVAPDAVAQGDSATLTWSSTDAQSCTASGGWSGAQATSGSTTTGALNATTTFNLSCTGSGGTAGVTRTVTVAPAGDPVVSLSASAVTVAPGGSTVLTWVTDSVTTCTASGDWSGARATNGVETVGPLSVDSTFTLSCTGPGGTESRSVNITIETPAPTIDLNISASTVDYDGSVTLAWSTTDVTSCTAFGGWSGARSSSGTVTINNLIGDTSFALTCTGPGGDATATVSVEVGNPAIPAVSLSASASQVAVGATATLTWSSTTATRCDAAGGWSGERATSGSELVGPLLTDASFSLVCSGPGGQSSQSVTIAVLADAPGLTVEATPASVDYDGGTVITWSSSDTDSCSAFGAWSGTLATSGSQAVSGLTSDSDFVVYCEGPGGDVTRSVTVSVASPAEPTVTFNAVASSIDYGDSAQLAWSTQDAQTCTAFGSWSGARGTSGSETIGPLTTDAEYILLCEGPGGSTVSSISIDVAAAPAPVVTLSATPTNIAFGGQTELSWQVDNADTCAASGVVSGSVATNDTAVVGPLYSNTSMTLLCSGPGGAVSESVAIFVANAADLPLSTFEQTPVGTEPEGWVASAPDFSTDDAPFGFLVEEFAAGKAVGLVTQANDLHTHYQRDQSTLWNNYRFTGRLYVSDQMDSVGATVLSGFSDEDSYYALHLADSGNFELDARGTTCNGDLTTGVIATSATWYRFSIEAESDDQATYIRAKVWRESDLEPDPYLAQCQDTTQSRLEVGTVGLRGSRSSATSTPRWDDLSVTPLNIDVVPPPVLSLLATPSSVSAGSSTSLSWTTRNALSCEASGDWSGTLAANGSQTVGPLATDSVFTLACTGDGGSTTRTVAVAVSDNSQLPVVTLTANPASVPSGGSTILTWTSSNATVCAASGDWSGVFAANGELTVSNITRDLSYELECIGAAGSTTASIDVTLSDEPVPPTLVLDIDYGTLPVDNTIVLRWESEHTDTCTAGGAWSGDRDVSGVATIGPISNTGASFSLNCTGRGGFVLASRTVSYDDSDADGMPDVWEVQFFVDLSNNGLGDTDGDGLTDRAEYTNGTNPTQTDTDNDGDSDFDEVTFGSDPRDPGDTFGGNRPQAPVLSAVADAALVEFVIDSDTGYVDPDGDVIASSQWEFSLDSEFEALLFARTVDGRTDLEVPAGVMDPGVRHFVRTRHSDRTGLISPWSNTVAVTGAISYPNDADGDGIDDDYQTPPNADANANGLPDVDEGMCNLYDAQGRSVIGFETNSGVVRCYRSVPNSALPDASALSGEIPFGTFSFRVEGLFIDAQNPAEIFLTVWFPEALDPDTGWVIYDPATAELMDFSSNVTINGNRAIVRYQDGGAGDQDGIVNGIIVDPSGPLTPVADTPPTPDPVSTPDPTPTSTPTTSSDAGGGGGASAPLVLAMLVMLCSTRRRWRLG